MARLVRPGDAILLEGPLGAGKTTFARGFLRAYLHDVSLEVPSPSFTLVQSYEAPRGTRVHHFDLWRLEGPGALVELSYDEALADIVLVEWPEKLGERRPAHALTVKFSFGEGDTRLAALQGWPDRVGALAEVTG